MKSALRAEIFQNSPCLSAEELQNYLQGASPAGERRRVEEHLTDCPLCSDALEGFQENPVAKIVPATFSEFRQQAGLPVQEAKIRQMTTRSAAVRLAAAAAILLFGWLGWKNWVQAPSGDQLYARFYQSYEDDVSQNLRDTQSGSKELNTHFLQAFAHYADHRFAESLPFFDSALHAEPGNDIAHFFSGMANMEMGQCDKALPHFEVVKNTQSLYARKAGWYAILAKLKIGEEEAARADLEEFVKTNGYNAAQAKDLLRDF